MTKFLIKAFIKNHEDVNSTIVRESYGRLAGIVGIITNAIISLLKIGIGLLVNSIAIIADGANNLTDAASSLITLIGFKLAAKKGDREHPYGHARYEYIAGMVVSAIIIIVGFNLLTSSIEKIREPEPLSFNFWIVAILLISIGVKVWQALFNIKLGKIINSSTLKATGTDSRNDVIATIAVLISVLFGYFTGLNIDGYMGLIVALFIMYSGVMLIKETSSPLLGQAPDPELVKAIEDEVLSYSPVIGVHDLVVHDYGPGNVFASVHIEVDAHEDILKSHDMIDNIENDVRKKLHVDLVAHMDPVDTKDPLVIQLSQQIGELIGPMPDVASFHDLRIVKGDTHTNVIFDMVLTIDNQENKSKLRKYLQDEISKTHPNFQLIIKYDLDYTAEG
jgi:cation diffusion facilitator family transporter